MDKQGTASRPELAELATLADALVNEISEARGRYEELAELIDSAEVTDRKPAPLRPVPIDDEAERVAAVEDEAHLVALAMATNGAERDEAHEHLVTSLGIDDPEEILDRAFSANPVADEPEEPRKRRRFRRSRG